MNKSKQNLKNLYSNAKTLGKVNPIFHWNVLLIVTCISFCFFAFYGLFLFYQVKNQTLFEEQVPDSIRQVSIKTKLLKDIESSFDKKSNKTNTLMTNKVQYADPSL